MYLLNVILCSALFLLVYTLLLKDKTMYHFNRFYLLTASLLSLLIPLLNLEQKNQTLPPLQTVTYTIFQNQESTPPVQMLTAEQPFWSSNNTQMLVLGIYILISSLLLLRFFKNLYGIHSKIRRNQKLPFRNMSLVLLPAEETPHTFFSFIFLNKQAYQRGQIEEQVLQHEFAHARQAHSADIIWIELLQVFLWFNPLILFYRRAIQLNHEFLADQSVLEIHHNVTDYQQLLLQQVIPSDSLNLTSHFNFSLTKKRLIMMTKNTPALKLWLSKLSVVPVLAVAILLFCNAAPKKLESVDQLRTSSGKLQIREKTSPAPMIQFFRFPATKQGVSPEKLAQYDAIVKKYAADENSLPMVNKNISKADREQLEQIFKQMSKEQQNKQNIVFSMPGKPLRKVKPTAEQLQNWQDAKTYGLWIDEKKVSNSALSGRQPEEFSQVMVSKLTSKALHHNEYKYQVDLMTEDYYEKYLQNHQKNKNKAMMLYSMSRPATK